jgi:hypothetical protein
MKRTIVTLVFALIALLASAQTSSTYKRQTTTEPITVTGTAIKMTSKEGAATSYQPVKTLIVREDRSNNPSSYVLNGPGHVLNKVGEVVQTAVKPGTRMRVYYVNTGDLRMVDHVVVFRLSLRGWAITNGSRMVRRTVRLFTYEWYGKPNAIHSAIKLRNVFQHIMVDSHLR